MAGAGDHAVRSVIDEGGGLLQVYEGAVLALFAFQDQGGAGHLGQQRPRIVLQSAHEERGLPQRGAGKLEPAGIEALHAVFNVEVEHLFVPVPEHGLGPQVCMHLLVTAPGVPPADGLGCEGVEIHGYIAPVEVLGKEDGLEEDQSPAIDPEGSVGDGYNGGTHGVSCHGWLLDAKGLAEIRQVLGNGQPVQTALVGIRFPVIAEIRGNDSPAWGQLAGDGMPQPRQEAGGMEEHDGRPVAFVKQVGKICVADILGEHPGHPGFGHD